MHLDFAVTLAGLVVGVIVGLTGMGGGALMTPILVIGFGIQPLAAVSSDLVASVVMKPIGGGIHFRRGTVHLGLVRWLAWGSVPGALAGSYVVSNLGSDTAGTIKLLLGVALLVAAGAMVVRATLGSRRPGTPAATEAAATLRVRRGATFVVGVFGGAIVGMTSVGSGSLMIVALMMLYPALSSKELVGTDLVQAIPLVGAAALGHLLWGDFQLGLTGSLLLGCVPGVIIGAHVSSRASDRFVRPALVVVLTLSALKLLDASNALLLAASGIGVLVAAAVVVVTQRRARQAARELLAAPAAPAGPASVPG